jgi:hypothetical protein
MSGKHGVNLSAPLLVVTLMKFMLLAFLMTALVALSCRSGDDDDQEPILALALMEQLALDGSRWCYSTPHVSRDGEHIAFSRRELHVQGNGCSGESTVVIADVKSGEMSDVGEGLSPVWSPDGRRLVVVEPTSDNVAVCGTPVYVLDIENGARVRLGMDALQIHGFSPDGQSVLLTVCRDPNAHTPHGVVVGLDGEIRRTLNADQYAWTPEGEVAIVDDAGITQIVEVETGEPRRATPPVFILQQDQFPWEYRVRACDEPNPARHCAQ